MAKYNNYIELSPNYESVVDINSDERKATRKNNLTYIKYHAK